ncbi:hypothetical protein C8P68_103278 [Mucilaginibacter yixingensis]|uniref:Uncharacterized protein n=1 Tax=Mucilaginibacter yixingensis TaxID=1295612 RepID=A0A2T5JB68_9SPHI|nr:hypothetical protein [Mucilaginibacter yixingensis]PTQ98118.1 hypothetical protein C8P68_103278 [Mucilaginibacter yixingensis]
MKKNISLSLIIGAAMIFGSCKKEGPNIFNMFGGLQIEFHTTDPKDVKEGEQTVHVGDQLQIDYTVTSADADMYGLVLIETGVNTGTKIAVGPTERRVKSGIQVLPAISRTGPISYRLYATDKTGTYIGDGYKEITLNVVNDFNYTTERYLYVPNATFKIDTNKTNLLSSVVSYPNVSTSLESFYSISNAATYSFAQGAANSAKIDCGVYMKVILGLTGTAPNQTLVATPHYYLYTPGVSPSPVPFPDFSFTGWTAKGTLFSANQVNTVFTAIKTGQQIADGASKVAVNLTNPELIPGGSNYFKTTDGKYGMIYAQAVGIDRLHPLYINILMKVQL